jgi:hypothetical protein
MVLWRIPFWKPGFVTSPNFESAILWRIEIGFFTKRSGSFKVLWWHKSWPRPFVVQRFAQSAPSN